MRRLRTFEALEERRLMAVGSFQQDGIAYRFETYTNNAWLTRLDLENEVWLSDLRLAVPSGTASSVAVGSDGIYVAYDSRVDRFDLDGSNRVEIVTATTKTIDRVFVDEIDESLLIMTHAGGSISTLDFATGTLTYSNPAPAASNTIMVHDPAHNRLFGSSSTAGQHIGSSYAAGALLAETKTYTANIYSGHYPILWLSPDGDRLFANSKRVNDAETAQQVGQLEEGVDKLAFLGSSPVVFNHTEMTLYDEESLLPIGKIDLNAHWYELVGYEGKLFAMSPQGGGSLVRTFTREDLTPPRPLLEPQQLSFTPDNVLPTSDGVLLMLSGTHRSVFRWDSATQDYLPTIELYDAPRQITYSATLNIAFLAYKSGLVSRIDLNVAEPREEMMAMLDYEVGLLAADDYLVAYPSSFVYNEWVAAYDAELNLVERKEVYWSLNSATWNSANQKVYFEDGPLYSIPFSGQTNPTSPLSNIASITHATPTGASYTYPIWVSPDGSQMITRSGHILDARTMVRQQRIFPEPFMAPAWLGSRVYTMVYNGDQTWIRRWDAALEKQELQRLRPGTALSLTAIGPDRLALVTRSKAGIPQVTLLDADLNVIHPAGAFTVVESGGNTIASEDGQTDTLEVALSHAPTSNVVVKVAPYDAQVAVSTATLTFTPENWNVPQIVQVSAPDDTTTDWESLSFVTLSVDEPASDAVFRGFGGTIVNVAIEDNDTTVLTEIDYGGIRYTFAANHNRVTRLDLATQTWLAPLVLDIPGMPTGAAVNEQGMFVSHDRNVYRYDYDGTNRTVEMQYSLRISRMWFDDNLLLLIADATSNKRVISYHTASEQIVNDVATTFQSTTLDRGARRLVGRTNSDTVGSLGYNPQGRLFDFRTVGIGSAFFLLPGGRLIDGGANVRSTATLEILGKPAGLPIVGYQAMALLDNGWIVGARYNSLDVFDTSFTIRGQLPINGYTQAMRVDELNIYVDSHSGGTQVVPIGTLVTKPAKPPEQLAHTPKEVLAIGDGQAYVNARLFAEVWRWNTATQLYDEPIRLKAVAETIAYSEANARLYIGYASGEITQIDPSAENPVEVPYAEAGDPLKGLVATGPYLFAVTTTSRKTFSPAGVQIDSMDYGGGTVEYFWNPTHKSVYHRDVSTGMTFLNYINVDGSIPGEPLGGISNSLSIGSAAYGGPVTISPDGNKIVFGDGTVFDVPLNQPAVQLLSGWNTDAEYIGNQIFTLRTISGNSELQRWNGTTLAQTGSTLMPGTAHSLTRLPGNRLLAVTIDSTGQPTLRIFNSDLTEVVRDYGLVIQESNGSTRVNESGTIDTIQVSLSGPPLTDVTIRVISGNLLEATVSPATLVFTRDNWNVPQTVTVTGVNDLLADKSQTVSLSFNTADVSIPARIVSVTVIDDENVSLPLIEHSGIAYFFMTNEARVDRLDQATGVWLPSIYLQEGVPTAAEVDGDGMYVAVGRSVYRHDLDGTPRGIVLTTDVPINHLFTDGNLVLVVKRSSPLETYDKTTGTRLAVSSTYAFDRFQPIGVDRARNRLYGLGSSSGVQYALYNDAGQISGPHQPTNEATTGIWTSPDGSKVFDSNGKVREAIGFTTLHTLPGGITEVAYHGEKAFVLRGNKLSVYSADMTLTHALTMNHVPQQLLLGSSHFTTLTLDMTAPGGYRVRTIPLSALMPVAPLPPLDPRYMAYTPDSMELTSDGVMLLLDKSRDMILRWDTNTQRYGRTIQLTGDVDAMTYHAPSNAIYVAYATKQVVRIDLDDPALAEQPVIELADRLTALGVAGEYLVTMPGLKVYRADGTLVDAAPGGYNVASPELIWNDARQRLYTIHSSSIGVAEINANGASYPGEVPGGVGATKGFDPETYNPYGTSQRFVRVSDSGNLGFSGRGHVLDLAGATPARLLSLTTTTFKDAAWIGERLFTLLADASFGSKLEARSEYDYSVTDYGLFSGTPHSLRALPANRLLLTTIGADGRPTFRVLESDLRSVPAAPAEIVGRHIFYNNSKFDQVAPGVDVNDAAIAVDKVAYLPGGGASGLANVSSYSRGINGLMIDIVGAQATLTVADFAFRLGTSADPSTWRGAPIPTGFTVRIGAGEGGSDRVEFTWPDGAIANTWLQVQVNATSRTRLAARDVSYFGSKIGESVDAGGKAIAISAGDELYTRTHGGLDRPITEPADHNKDGLVNAADALLVRAQFASPILWRLDLPGPAVPLAAATLDAKTTHRDTIASGLAHLASSLAFHDAAAMLHDEPEVLAAGADERHQQADGPSHTIEMPVLVERSELRAAVFATWLLEADGDESELGLLTGPVR